MGRSRTRPTATPTSGSGERVRVFLASLAIAAALAFGGCTLFLMDEQEDGIRGRYVTMVTTAYCPCEICCSWTRDAKGNPVVSAGRGKGKPKQVGVTASGTKARPGTIAADTRYYPMGTVMWIEGYGYGVVEDRGGKIRGRHRIDLFHATHAEAKKWGKKKQSVVVWPAGSPVPPKDAPAPEP